MDLTYLNPADNINIKLCADVISTIGGKVWMG